MATIRLKIPVKWAVKAGDELATFERLLYGVPASWMVFVKWLRLEEKCYKIDFDSSAHTTYYVLADFMDYVQYKFLFGETYLEEMLLDDK